MNTREALKFVEQAGASLAVGGIFYLGAVSVTGVLATTVSEEMRPTQACAAAAHLGVKATEAADIPQKCLPYLGSFGKVTTTVESHVANHPISQDTTQITVKYTYPTKADFEKEMLQTAQTDAIRSHYRRIGVDIGTGLVGVLMAGMAYAQSTVTDRRVQKLIAAETKS